MIIMILIWVLNLRESTNNIIVKLLLLLILIKVIHANNNLYI